MRRVDGAARQHRHQSQEQRQLAVADAGEVEANRQRVGRLDPFHLPEGLALLRPTLGLEELEGEAHVVRRDHRAVREARQGIEVEGREGTGVVGVHAFRDQAVEREGLVLRARHQGLEHHRVQPLGGRAGLEVEGVQAVEGAEQAQAQPPSLGRVRVGVGEVGEAVGQGGSAVHGDRRRRTDAGRAAERSSGARQSGQEGEGGGAEPRPRGCPVGDHVGNARTRCWCGCDHGRARAGLQSRAGSTTRGRRRMR